MKEQQVCKIGIEDMIVKKTVQTRSNRDDQNDEMGILNSMYTNQAACFVLMHQMLQ